MSNVTLDYTDKRGIKRRVLIPDYTVPPEEGIVISLQLDALYSDSPLAFVRRLTDEFWARGLIEPRDFFLPTALRDMQSALLAAHRYDAMNIQSLAQEQNSNANDRR